MPQGAPPEPPSLVLRADASPEIGLGHVMRSLALAQAWRRAGGRATLVGHWPPLAVLKRAEIEGLSLRRLDRPSTAPREWLDGATRAAGAANWVALDGYRFPADHFAAVRQSGARVLAIEDGPRLPRYEMDLVLDTCPGSDTAEYCLAIGTRLLAGPQFALLREEVLAAAPRRQHPVQARRLLVSLGGSDPTGATLTVIDALHRVDMPNLDARVVVGPANPRRDDIARAAAHDPRLRMVEPDRGPATGTALSQLASWAELAVVAAGGTCWELAYLGVPAGAIVVADNQAGSVAALARRGILLNLGRREQLCPPELADTLTELMTDAAQRRRLAARGRELIDGRGADRVVAAMRAFDQPMPRVPRVARPPVRRKAVRRAEART
jgi:UDP-2,4-diacetamido-2,4,6-trideoxy-beta-L-altropyranose hydrolase